VVLAATVAADPVTRHRYSREREQHPACGPGLDDPWTDWCARTATVSDVRRVLVIALAASALFAAPNKARAACPAPRFPPPTFKHMIRSGSTFNDYFHRMIIGRVVAIRDPGKSGGKARAVVAVAAQHPTGFVPRVARVRLFQPRPGAYVEDNLVFKTGQLWVVIARHLHSDGSYRSDGGCGRSESVSKFKLRTLLHLYRRLN
jgi:hypothetical protein